jgi:hypothetical protein
MRYYSYISDAKVDMLLPSVPGAVRKNVALRVGFDVKILSACLSSEHTTLDDRVARLLVVEDFIRSHEDVGEPGESKSWMAGAADATLVDLGKGAIMFVIIRDDGVVGLGGSTSHLIGGSQAKDASNIPPSFLPTLADLLAWTSERPPPNFLARSEKEWIFDLTKPVTEGFHAWVSTMEWFAQHRQAIGIPQRISFLAKRLVSQREPNDRVYTLATPLFVATD